MATSVSGKDGNVALDAVDVENVLSWDMTWERDTHSAAHSDSSGWEQETGGIQRWSGTITMQVDNGKIASAIDTAVSGATDVAVTLTSFTGATYTGNVRLTSWATSIDITGGGTVEATIPFKGNGALTRTTT